MESEKLVEIAREIATRAHEGQFRRGGVVPYIEHPRSVVSRVENDPDASVVAWLHDVLEDSEITPEELKREGIPAPLIDAVKILTRSNNVQYGEYIAGIAASPLASKVKVADMLANLSDNPSRKQIRKYAKALLILVPE